MREEDMPEAQHSEAMLGHLPDEGSQGQFIRTKSSKFKQ